MSGTPAEFPSWEGSGVGWFMGSLAPKSCTITEFRNCLTIVSTLTIFAACQISSCVLS